MKRCFIIIDVADITDEMISESLNEDDTFVDSADGSRGILKFGTLFPSSMKGRKKFSQEEITQYLKDNELEWKHKE